MEEIVICSETEGVNAEEKNSEVERAIFERLIGSQVSDMIIDTVEVSGEFARYKGETTRKGIGASAFTPLEYDVYKASKVKAKRFSDDEISHQLKEIQDELDRLQIEGEERFKLNKLYSSNHKIEQSHSALHLVQNMQRFVHGLLSSKEFKETTVKIKSKEYQN